MRARSRLVHPLSAVALLAAAVPAQRNTAKVDWHERQAAIEYGVVRLGKHSLDELPPGQSWRMGQNEASVFRAQAPVCVGDTVVPPGSYRIEVFRKAEKEFLLRLVGAAAALANTGDLGLAGELAAAPKPNDKLAVDWTPVTDKPAKDAINLDSRIKVQFGANLMTVAATLLSQKQVKVRGYTVDVFSLPAELLQARLAKGLPTPVASVHGATAKKNAPFWNLVLGKGTAALVPAMEAPTDSFGFGEPKTPGSNDIRKGTLQTADTSVAKAVLEPGKIERAGNGDLSLVLYYGTTAATVVVPDPAGKASGER